MSGVSELRMVVTVDDYDGAIRFYGETLGLAVGEEWAQRSPGDREAGTVIAHHHRCPRRPRVEPHADCDHRNVGDP